MSEPAPRRAPPLRERILELGALRVALLAAIAVLVASAPFASLHPGAFDVSVALAGDDGPFTASGAIWLTLVAPPLAVMMAFVVPLDMLMTRIYMTDKQGAERARYRRILAAETLAFLLLVAAWAPFFFALLSL